MMLRRTRGKVVLLRREESPARKYPGLHFKSKRKKKGNIIKTATVSFLCAMTVKDHDDPAGPEEQCAEAGSEEPVSEDPEGVTSDSQQPAGTPTRTIIPKVSFLDPLIVHVQAFLNSPQPQRVTDSLDLQKVVCLALSLQPFVNMLELQNVQKF